MWGIGRHGQTPMQWSSHSSRARLSPLVQRRNPETEAASSPAVLWRIPSWARVAAVGQMPQGHGSTSMAATRSLSRSMSTRSTGSRHAATFCWSSASEATPTTVLAMSGRPSEKDSAASVSGSPSSVAAALSVSARVRAPVSAGCHEGPPPGASKPMWRGDAANTDTRGRPRPAPGPPRRKHRSGQRGNTSRRCRAAKTSTPAGARRSGSSTHPRPGLAALLQLMENGDRLVENRGRCGELDVVEQQDVQTVSLEPPETLIH